MDSGKITLLAQLITALSQNFLVLEKYYQNSDKERYESSKKIVLELQSKIDSLLK